MAGCGVHDRWTIGCGPCISAREAIERRHEYKTAPYRTVTFRWSVKTNGTIVTDVKIPASWLDDPKKLSDELDAVFDEEVHAALADVLLRIVLDSFDVGEVVPAETEPAPALEGFWNWEPTR